MSATGDFTSRGPKPLPVIVLADVSGSMGVDGKIDALNRSITAMARDFAENSSYLGEIYLAIVTFGGGDAKVVQGPVPASEFRWVPVEAGGKTPLGRALSLTAGVLEDREQLPSRSYRPTLVLVSDGRPTDEWEPALERLLSSERASKAFRFAIAIGADCQRDVLERFIGDSTVKVFEAHEANQISEFFNRVTMSVTRAITAGDYTTRDRLDLETLTAEDDDIDA